MKQNKQKLNQKQIQKRRENNEKRKMIQFINTFPFTTQMSETIMRSFDIKQLNSSQIQRICDKIEKNCKTLKINKKSFLNNYSKYNNWNLNTIEEKCFKSDFSSKSCDKCFQYSILRHI